MNFRDLFSTHMLQIGIFSETKLFDPCFSKSLTSTFTPNSENIVTRPTTFNVVGIITSLLRLMKVKFTASVLCKFENT